MTIQPLNDKAGNVTLSSKNTATNKVQGANSEQSQPSKDSVDITQVARGLTKAFESSKATSVINEERVNAVRKALEEGTYPINADRIAEKMIQIEKQQFYDSR